MPFPLYRRVILGLRLKRVVVFFFGGLVAESWQAEGCSKALEAVDLSCRETVEQTKKWLVV